MVTIFIFKMIIIFSSLDIQAYWLLDHLDFLKDLGVTFDTKLKFDHHIKENLILGLI